MTAWSFVARKKPPPLVASCCRVRPPKSRFRAKWSPLGKGKILENGEVRPMDVKVGDTVLFGKYSGTEVTRRRHHGRHRRLNACRGDLSAISANPRNQRIQEQRNECKEVRFPMTPASACSRGECPRQCRQGHLGPKGRNVVLRSPRRPTITKDGVSVAKEIELSDKFENMGAQMVKKSPSKTSDIAGDGTTTATVLAQAMPRRP